MTIKELRQALEAAVSNLETAHRAITDAGDDADVTALDAAFTEAETEHRNALEAFNAAKEREERAAAVRRARTDLPVAPVEDDEVETRTDARVSDDSNEVVYSRQSDHSMVRDLYLATRPGQPADMDAVGRLQRHRQDMDVAARSNPELRAINSTDGSGGEFVPPLWAQQDWIKLAKAGRAFFDACRSMPLPGGTDTINMPSVATGATTAAQADAGSVSSTDITTSSYSVGVKTIAGQQDLSQQLLDRSVPGVDQVIFEELHGRYAINIDTQLISGGGGGTNATGVLSLSGTNGVTYTDASPTVPELYSKIADAVQRVHTGRFLPPSAIVMHPTRWAWILASLDSNSRPLVVPAGGSFNQAAVLENVASEAVVGQMHGLPVIVDPNIPTNLGAGTNEDRILVARLEDLWTMEDSPVRTRVLYEVLSGTLQVRVQLYNYFALPIGRYPKSISIVSGTGLVTPTF